MVLSPRAPIGRCSARLPYVVALVLLAASLVTLIVVRHPSELHSAGRAVEGLTRAQSSVALPLLQRVFACVTFHFDVQNLSNLKLTLLTLTAYPTVVHICVASDDAQNLKPALAKWGIAGAQLCDIQNTSVSDAAVDAREANSSFGVTWYHHMAIQTAAAQDYTAYMLLEDDLCPSWSALVSWATEAPLLEERGHQRCFFRTEYRPSDGRLVMQDQSMQLDLPTWQKFLNIDVPSNDRCDDTDHVRRIIDYNVSEAAQASHGVALNIPTPERCIHQHYIQLPATYQGIWVASKSLLEAYINSSWWDVQFALQAHGPVVDLWGVPERANAVIQLVNVAEGWDSACLIPWVPEMRVLAPIAMLEHERVRYSVKSAEANPWHHATIPYSDYLVGEPPGQLVPTTR